MTVPGRETVICRHDKVTLQKEINNGGWTRRRMVQGVSGKDS